MWWRWRTGVKPYHVTRSGSRRRGIIANRRLARKLQQAVAMKSAAEQRLYSLRALLTKKKQTAIASVNSSPTGRALVRGFRWLRRSKRMLLIISPFLTIVVVLVWLATLSIDILAAGRAYVEGESLWSKNQKEAVAGSTDHCNTTWSLSAGVSNPKVLRGR
jgi:hypothetical protein